MRRRLIASALGLVLCPVLAGCGLQPLYATGEDSRGVAAELSAISIPAPRDRLSQIIRNDLLSSMKPVGTDSLSRYTLEIETVDRLAQAAKLNDLGADRRTVVVNVTYRLSENSSGKVIEEGKTFSQVSYDETGQSFADARAKDNAYERAAHELSQDIRSRLAAHFASG